MKLIIFALLISLFTNAQKPEPYKFRVKEHIVSGSLMILAGAADGLRDAVTYHNDRVLKGLNVSPRFWGADSWRNKYKNGDPQQGEKFPGSTSVFVFVTDAPHLLKFLDNFFTAGAISFKIVQGNKKRWYLYIAEAAGYWILNRLAFTFVYSRF